MYIMSLMISSMLAISASNWAMFWLFMELNAFTFMSYLKYSSKKKSIKLNLSSEQMMIYFYINFISSVMVIIPMIFTFNYGLMEMSIYNKISMIMMIAAISLKMGAFPTHSWMYQISSFMSMPQMSILLTIQKIIPINLLFLVNSKIMILAGMMSSLTACLMTYYSFQPNPFLVTSSLNSTGWIIVSSYSNMNVSILYYLIYSFMVITLAKEMINMSNDTIVNLNKYTWNFMIVMFSMIGIPPLLGFIPKLMAMKDLSLMGLNLPMVILILSTSFMAWIYLSALMSPTLASLNQKKEEINISTVMIQMIIPTVIMINLMMN